jgi:predicted SAM-dependent methyltransferase
MNKLNIGSGQRRFENAFGWVNVDAVSRPGEEPDLICDVGKEPLPYDDGTIDCIVLHHVYEHFRPGDGHGIVLESHRVLRAGGSLILTLPNWRALAERWLTGQIDDYIYFINMYGTWRDVEDAHKWGYSMSGLKEDLMGVAPWSRIAPFNWREIHGAYVAKDWWINGIEAIK